MDIVAQEHDVDSAQDVGFRSSAPGREMAAFICRRFTSSTLAQRSVAFGLRHPDSAANLEAVTKPGLDVYDGRPRPSKKQISVLPSQFCYSLLVRRANRSESESAKYRSRLKRVKQVMMKTENQG